MAKQAWGIVAIAIVLTAASTAEAFWWPSAGRSRPAYAYAAPMSGYTYPTPMPAYTYPTPMPAYASAPVHGIDPCLAAPGGIQIRPVPREPLAVPRPAPPSTSEPPLAAPPKRAPVITETKSQGGRYETVGEAKAKLLVGFWNLSGHDVRLTVDGKSHVVAKDKAIHLELQRSFVWRADQGEPTTERVPEDRRRYEVLIR
jgi:hypothetical protein